MPPKLILWLGLGFAFFMLRTGKRRGIVDPPPGLFWPTLWYMVVSSRLAGIWLETWGVPLPGGGDARDGSIVDASFFLLLTIVGLVVLSKRNFDWGATLRYNPWVAALFIYMALSIVWSGYPYVSFKRYIKVLGSVTMAMVVLSNPRPLDAITTVLRRTFYVHLPMSIICIKYFRTIGVSFDWSGASSSWTGISTSKNDLGQVAMLAILLYSWDIYLNWKRYRWKNLHVLYLGMGCYLIKGSESAISMTSVSVCILLLFVFVRLQYLRRRIEAARGFVKLIFRMTVSLVVLISVHSVVMFSENSLFGMIITKFGRDITLTDRTKIWHDVYAAASGNPLLGVGFGGFWIGRMANIPWNTKMTWVLAQAHSGYVDTYLQLGFIGEGLMAMVLLSTMPRLLAALPGDFDFSTFRIALLIALMFVNITESTYLRGDHHFWLVMQLVIWQMPTWRRVGAGGKASIVSSSAAVPTSASSWGTGTSAQPAHGTKPRHSARV